MERNRQNQLKTEGTLITDDQRCEAHLCQKYAKANHTYVCCSLGPESSSLRKPSNEEHREAFLYRTVPNFCTFLAIFLTCQVHLTEAVLFICAPVQGR